jgi:hypothetical protein
VISDMWVILGFVVAIGLPLAVIVGAIYWPERIPPNDRSMASASASSQRTGGADTGLLAVGGGDGTGPNRVEVAAARLSREQLPT